MNRRSRTVRTTVASALCALLLVAGTLLAADEQTAKTMTRFSDSSTDRTPAKTAFPSYPKIARRDRIEGDATVCFKIDLRGRIRSVRVKSYSHRIFRRPVIRAIKDSSFEPLQPDEVFSAERTCRTYRFRLEPIVADADTSQSSNRPNNDP